jgi:hypothetical protein
VTFSLHEKQHLTPDLLTIAASGYALSHAMFAALGLEIFEALPSSTTALAEKRGLRSEILEPLLRLLASFGFVEKDGEEYRNTPLTQTALTREGPHTMVDTLRQQSGQVLPLFAGLERALREGCRRSVYQDLARDPTALALFLSAMDQNARGAGAALAGQVQLSGLLFDVAGGGGQIARELTAACPTLKILLFEQEAALPIVQSRCASEPRISCRAADIYDDLPWEGPPADAVLLAGIVCDATRENTKRLLRNVKPLLAPQGRLLISDTFLDESGDSPPIAAMVGLALAIGMGGRGYTTSEFSALLADEGFLVRDVKRNKGQRDLLVATL